MQKLDRSVHGEYSTALGITTFWLLQPLGLHTRFFFLLLCSLTLKLLVAAGHEDAVKLALVTAPAFGLASIIQRLERIENE